MESEQPVANDRPRFVSSTTYANGTTINQAMAAFLAHELNQVSTAVREVKHPELTAPSSKRRARQRASADNKAKKVHRMSTVTTSDGSNHTSDQDSHSSAEGSETASISSRSIVTEDSTSPLYSNNNGGVQSHSRAKRRARRAADSTKPQPKKKPGSNLQSKDGARQRLKCLCKQYLVKFQKHPSECVPEFIEWVRATKFKKADTRCNCEGGPDAKCECTGCAHCRLERTVLLCQQGGMNWPHKASARS
eukprot:TRINITY_DN17493_c0_g1_i1.p1 TRINITY_DN17493_c0_g1~~TRINITY_DN17493_c0_g1_i1.p1  ORF type:complete len:249 (+),score=39.05 TRINITY_DN17493_c0_g1_i1:228-974(+)